MHIALSVFWNWLYIALVAKQPHCATVLSTTTHILPIHAPVNLEQSRTSRFRAFGHPSSSSSSHEIPQLVREAITDSGTPRTWILFLRAPPDVEKGWIARVTISSILPPSTHGFTALKLLVPTSSPTVSVPVAISNTIVRSPLRIWPLESLTRVPWLVPRSRPTANCTISLLVQATN